ncbi:MAG: ribonuclease Y, partial [Clostridia bacterium]|nr:ribonuclease Y [Clostridia bacterium]
MTPSPASTTILLFAIAGVVLLAIGVVFGILLTENKHKRIAAEQAAALEAANRRIAESETKAAEILRSANKEASKIASEASRAAENRKKEMLIEAKDEIFRLRTESDNDLKERRKEIQRSEQRLSQKEEAVDRKLENLDKKEEQLSERIKQQEAKVAEAEELRQSQIKLLEEMSGYTAEQAKAKILDLVETELTHEKALKIKAYENTLKEEMDNMAREILSIAIQRCAADQVSEVTVSVVPLPNDEMKGRIIGREGRNIRTIETITGVDLIIDDTPEAITVSSFDPVRREIARLSLERLISDGRIHPARIEEIVNKTRTEVEAIIKEAGEQAAMEAGVVGLNSELIKILGRLRYRTSYGQNALNHSLEGAYIAGLMASELGINPTLARRAGLLHDIGKAIDHETEGSHIAIGVDLAKKYRENEVVINAIGAHHGDVEPTNAISVLVAAADAVSAARPGARRENIQTYIKRLEKLESIANEFPGVERSFAMQAGRE